MRVAVILIVVILALVVVADKDGKRSRGSCRCNRLKYKLFWYKLNLYRDLFLCHAVKRGLRENYTPLAEIDEIRQLISDNTACCGNHRWFKYITYAIDKVINQLSECRGYLTTTTTTMAPTTTEPPAPTTVEPPAPTTVEPPAPTTVEPPAPTTVEPPAPTTVEPPAPTTVEPPAPTTTEPPAPTTTEPPAPTTVEPPAPTTVEPSALDCRTDLGGSCAVAICPGTARPDALCDTGNTCCIL